MLNSIKFLVTLSVSALLVLSSCSKNGVEPEPVKTTYHLTMKATMTDANKNVMLNVKDINGKTKTLPFLFKSWSEDFDISKGHNIFITINGVNDSPATPSVTLEYFIEKFENGVSKGIVCFLQKGSSGPGKPGSWPIDLAIDKTFDGTACN